MQRRRLLALGGLLPLAWARQTKAHEFYAPSFTVVHPWVWHTLDGQTSAELFLKIESVRRSDRLLRAESPVARRVVFQVEGGQAPAALPVTQGEDVAWTRESGRWLLLDGLSGPLIGGRSYPLQLWFDQAGLVDGTFFVEQRFN